MDHHLSIEECLRFGWEKTKSHSTLIFQALITLFALQIALQIVFKVLYGTFEGALAMAALIFIYFIVWIGFIAIILRIARGHSAEYSDLVPKVTVWISYLAANILAAIVIIVPLIVARTAIFLANDLLPAGPALGATVIIAAVAYVTAVYFALRYSFVRYAILEDTDIIKSLRTSARITEGHKWWLLGFTIVVVLLNAIGALLLTVGLLVTIPVTMFAFAHAYIELRERHHAANN